MADQAIPNANHAALGLLLHDLLDELNAHGYVLGPTFAERVSNVLLPKDTYFQGMLAAILDDEPAGTASSPQLLVASEQGMTVDQKTAWGRILKWLATDAPYFILRGFAGTGKTWMLRALAEHSHNVFFSAPTNQAAKVLSRAINREARTTYSLMGVRMEQEDDQLVLAFGEEMPHFSKGDIVVIDEASMCNAALCNFLEKVRVEYGIKILYVGDPAQLPPVGERISPCWRVTDDTKNKGTLREVRRTFNQILGLSVKVRKCLSTKNYVSPIESDNDGKEGVWKLKLTSDFQGKMIETINADNYRTAKVVAWRNKAVDRYNSAIRRALGFEDLYCANDLLLLAAPVQVDGKIIATIDEEVLVREVSEVVANAAGHSIDAWRLHTTRDTGELALTIPKDKDEFDAILAVLASEARAAKPRDKKAKWKTFWDTKNGFQYVRYAYAMTAHRVQGTTLNTVFLDQRDILANPDKSEAFRCLYVGVTRASHRLYSN